MESINYQTHQKITVTNAEKDNSVATFSISLKLFLKRNLDLFKRAIFFFTCLFHMG